jgi:molecular chaperone GrpE
LLSGALDFCRWNPDMPGSDWMGKDMTEQTARAEDAAGPQEGRSPATEPAGDSAALAAELKDKLLRTLAEMENLRKRTAREVSEARAYGVGSFARDMLAVADNMRRALDAVSPELRASVEPGVKALVEGVELTERELLKALEKNGVRQFTPRGEKFDPNLHQAMFEVPDAAVPAGSVVEVVAPGYMIGERVLRPAMVGVSKGGAKSAPGARPVNDNAASRES